MGRRFARRLPLLALLLPAGCFEPLPPAPAHARAQPVASPPAELEVVWLEYQRFSSPGGPITKGPTDAKSFDCTVSGLLVRHPQGSLLIDAGNSSRLREEIRGLGFGDRQKVKIAAARGTVFATAGDAVKKAGVDPASLKAVIVSHAHLDHLGGMVDLPGVPVWMPQEELDFVAKEKGTRTVFLEHAKAIEGRASPIPFAAAAYETFDESFDVFGDGSVVVVKLPGHTPGSIGTFLTLPSGKRVMHVGDSVWLAEQITRRSPKGRLVRESDYDHAKTNEVIPRLTQLGELDPALLILPAHDRPVWVKAFGAPAGSQPAPAAPGSTKTTSR